MAKFREKFCPRLRVGCAISTYPFLLFQIVGISIRMLLIGHKTKHKKYFWLKASLSIEFMRQLKDLSLKKYLKNYTKKKFKLVFRDMLMGSQMTLLHPVKQQS